MNNFISILAVGPVTSYSGFNTCIQRINAFKKLGAEVEVIDTTNSTGGVSFTNKYISKIRNVLFRLGVPIDVFTDKTTLKLILNNKKLNECNFLWLDKILDLDGADLKVIKNHKKNGIIVGFSPDDMNGRHNQTQQFLRALPNYDLYVTTKSYNTSELKDRGVKNVYYMENGYCSDEFYQVQTSCDDELLFGGDIGFIGTYEKERADSMMYLVNNGLKVRIWGAGWEKFKSKHPNLRIENNILTHKNFSIACNAFKINLGFLRKSNRDLQTTRSIEIPGAGGFMLAERTVEHMRLFNEGEEAEFFDSNEELLHKCKYYLKNDNKRKFIAKNGQKKCIDLKYNYEGRLEKLLEYIGWLR